MAYLTLILFLFTLPISLFSESEPSGPCVHLFSSLGSRFEKKKERKFEVPKPLLWTEIEQNESWIARDRISVFEDKEVLELFRTEKHHTSEPHRHEPHAHVQGHVAHVHLESAHEKEPCHEAEARDKNRDDECASEHLETPENPERLIRIGFASPMAIGRMLLRKEKSVTEDINITPEDVMVVKVFDITGKVSKTYVRNLDNPKQVFLVRGNFNPRIKSKPTAIEIKKIFELSR